MIQIVRKTLLIFSGAGVFVTSMAFAGIFFKSSHYEECVRILSTGFRARFKGGPSEHVAGAWTPTNLLIGLNNNIHEHLGLREDSRDSF